MKYIINKNFRLRGWTDHLVCLESLPDRRLTDLSVKEGLCLLKCDGQREADEERFGPEIRKFLSMGVISETEGDSLLPEQEYIIYENKRFRSLSLSITGSCDFRCRHCFNAAEDDKPRGTTPATSDIIDLIGRMDECGVARITITGGEPVLNKDLLKITRAIKDRGMIFHVFNTNLYHMTEDIADEIKAQGHNPRIFTSFDGIGTHEWLRMKEGSEKRTLEKIRMMKEKGYNVLVHMCVWKDSLKTVRDTAKVLSSLGVDCLRITSVEPSFRFMRNYADQYIEPRQWIAFATDFIRWWYEEKIDMHLDVWGLWMDMGDNSTVRILPEFHGTPEDQYRVPFCSEGYERPYIDCDGRILTCIGISGASLECGFDWGNVYKDDLHHLLRDGEFIKLCKHSIGSMKDNLEQCRNCKWRSLCNFGCRAESLGQGNGLEGLDERVCIFFREGYYDQFRKIAEDNGLKIYNGKK